MAANEIWKWDAAAVAAAIRAGEISSREAVASNLERLHSVNPAINAVVEVLEDEALAAADQADAQMREGNATGALHGVPVTAKINVDLAGHATTTGLVAMKDAIATEDSIPVANLRRAGAIIIGQTNVPAFCYRWFTSNDLHGLTRNPWDPTLSPGGSSGGAAAATAVGIGTFGHGNDVAGSLRLPAGACGVYGFKPTVGRLPDYNPSQSVEKSLGLQIGATEGLIARSVRDLRLGLEALAAPDYRSPSTAPAPAPRIEDELPCRVAMFVGDAETPVDPEIAAIMRKAGSWLEEAGYVVEEVAPPHLAEMAELWMAMLYAETSDPAREFMFGLGGEAFRQSFLDTAANLPVLNPEQYQEAWKRRMEIQRAWAAFFQTYPVVLTPTACMPTFPLDHDLAGTEVVGAIARAYRPLSAIAGLAVPAISVPAGFAAGVPAGVQVISRWYGEDRALSAAAVMEAQIGRIVPIDPKLA